MNNKNKNRSIELVKQFKDITLFDFALIGGKNFSVGEMFSRSNSKGIKVPDGFAATI